MSSVQCQSDAGLLSRLSRLQKCPEADDVAEPQLTRVQLEVAPVLQCTLHRACEARDPGEIELPHQPQDDMDTSRSTRVQKIGSVATAGS